MEFKLNPRQGVAVWGEISITGETSPGTLAMFKCCASGQRSPSRWSSKGISPLYSSVQNESPGARWRALSLNMAPALSICQWLGRISSGSINQKPTFGELCPGPHLKVPATVCASCNPGKRQVEQVGLTWQGGKMVLIQTLGDDFLWGRSNPVSQHGFQEVVEPPTDGVSNSICSRSAGGSVLMPRSNLLSCSLVTEEMLGLSIIGNQ